MKICSYLTSGLLDRHQRKWRQLHPCVALCWGRLNTTLGWGDRICPGDRWCKYTNWRTGQVEMNELSILIGSLIKLTKKTSWFFLWSHHYGLFIHSPCFSGICHLLSRKMCWWLSVFGMGHWCETRRWWTWCEMPIRLSPSSTMLWCLWLRHLLATMALGLGRWLN